jgi:hypothetical protein
MDLELLATYSAPIMLTGDVNIHLNRVTDQDSIRFRSILEAFDLTQHVSEPTHDHGNTLDVIVTSNDHSPSGISIDEVGVELSDHRLLSWSVDISPPVPHYVTVSKRV